MRGLRIIVASLLLLAAVVPVWGASQQLMTFGMYYPTPPPRWTFPALADTSVIDATGEQVGYCGRVWWPSRTGTKAIRRVQLRFGAITKAGGSGLTISLQSINTASGSVAQPDETQDQTVAVGNAEATFDDNRWHRTGVLSADRTVSFGELLCVVTEYDGSGRLGADSVTLSAVTLSSDPSPHLPITVHKTASWAVQARVPNVVLEADDGSLAIFAGAPPAKDITSQSFSDSDDPDEYGMEISLPGPVKVDGVWVVELGPGGANRGLDLKMYENAGTTAMTNGTITVDDNTISANSGRYIAPFPAELTLNAGTNYIVSVRATGTSAARIQKVTLDASSWLPFWGVTSGMRTRNDDGAWGAADNVTVFAIGVSISAIDDGAGGGGGGGATQLIGGGLVR